MTSNTIYKLRHIVHGHWLGGITTTSYDSLLKKYISLTADGVEGTEIEIQKISKTGSEVITEEQLRDDDEYVYLLGVYKDNEFSWPDKKL